MHKGWVRIDAEREAKFWKNEGRPEKYRYIEETDDTLHFSQAFVEYWEDIRDETDEPLFDGLYQDNNGERWIRLNGKWLYEYDAFSDWETWETRVIESAPVTLINPSHY